MIGSVGTKSVGAAIALGVDAPLDQPAEADRACDADRVHRRQWWKYNLAVKSGREPAPEAQKKAWDTFRNDPEWKRLSKEDEYKDVVSNITNLILRPSSASQI